jgi:anti-sigma regulatory factor (Ser/Thr protein kinase)
MRERLHEWLDHAGMYGPRGLDLITASNEAFINAVEHAVASTRNAVEIDAELLTPSTVAVTVRDFGNWQHETSTDRDHHGYPLMNALTDTVHTETTAEGTTVTLTATFTKSGVARQAPLG